MRFPSAQSGLDGLLDQAPERFTHQRIVVIGGQDEPALHREGKAR